MQTKSSRYTYEIADWIAKLVAVNLLWILFNIPLIALVLNVFIVDQVESLFALVIPTLICIILFLFPSTSSMFTVVKNLVLKVETKKNVFSQFYTNYKKNYKRSVISGLFLTVVWVFIIIDIYLFSYMNKILYYLFIMLSAILVTFTVNLFSTIVYFEQGFIESIKKTLFITISNPIYIPIITFGNVLIFYFSINYFQFLLPLCTGSMIALFSFYFYHQMVKKEMPLPINGS